MQRFGRRTVSALKVVVGCEVRAQKREKCLMKTRQFIQNTALYSYLK